MDFRNGSTPERPEAPAYMFQHYYLSRHYQLQTDPYDAGRSRTPKIIDQGIDFSTPTQSWPKNDGPQTVEQLVDQGYFAAPRGDPTTAILDDKLHTSWLGLDDTIAQLRHRQTMYEQHMKELQWAECYAFNDLARDGWPATVEQYQLYARRLHDLKSEQRMERVSFWRDVSRLRQQLPESAQQYLGNLRKIDILRDLDGDAT